MIVFIAWDDLQNILLKKETRIRKQVQFNIPIANTG